VDYLDFAVEISRTENNFRIRAESPFMAPTESAFELPYDERGLDAVLDRVELAVRSCGVVPSPLLGRGPPYRAK